jgi:hypothetical protein
MLQKLTPIVSFLLAVVIGVVCIKISLNGMPTGIKELWAIGFGQVTGKNLSPLKTSLAGGVILANLPQLLLSYLYLAFNALCTTMFMAKEWSSYAHRRKPLRVTAPIGKQRETYWLNLPFRYGIPMQILASLFHWLTSSSIFLVRIVVLDYGPRLPLRTISTNGFSPIAIILATSLGILIAIIGFITGRFKFSSAMPVAASCSAVISAACHPAAEDTNASVLPVQWGAVTHGKRGGDCLAEMSADLRVPSGGLDPDGSPVERSAEDSVGHCTFSSLPVEEPIDGRLYA